MIFLKWAKNERLHAGNLHAGFHSFIFFSCADSLLNLATEVIYLWWMNYILY